MPTALFIHGAGGGGWEWNLWKPVFEAAGWTCVAPDLQPATGGIASTRLRDYEAQIVKWAADAGQSAVIIGASMGGILALKASGKFSFAAIVLVNTVGPRGFPGHQDSDWPEVIEWSHGTFEATRDALPDSDEAVVQFAHQHWRDESGAVLCELQQGVSVDRPSCPVLLIAGEDDEDVPATVSASLAQAWDADLWLLPDQKHLCPLLGRGAPALAQQVVEWSGGLGIRVGPLKGQMLQATCSPGNVK